MTDRRIVIQKAGDGYSIILHFNFTIEANEAQRIVRTLTDIRGISSVTILDYSKMRVDKVRRRIFNTDTLAEVVKTNLRALFEDAELPVFKL